MSEIFLITEQQKLVPLATQPYATEDLLQKFLADYPSLMAGDQMNPSAPRRWMLVKREAEVPGEPNDGARWSLDHLFLDQEGVPTLVEVKRSTDTRIRREVVGQMLDYAAYGVKYWPFEALRASFEATCAAAKTDPEVKVRELIGEAAEPEDYWKSVKTNLQAGRIRMVFVADDIPDELRRVIEFLNEQMDPAEVLGLEIKQFVGGTLRTLVPRVIGQTIEAEDRKRVSTNREKRQWTEAAFFEELALRGIAGSAQSARSLLDWANRHELRVWWGQGAVNGSFIPVLDIGKTKNYPFAVYTGPDGGRPYVSIYFQMWARRRPFDARPKRLHMLNLLNQIPGLSLKEDAVDRLPNIPLSILGTPEALAGFISAMDFWVSEVLQSSNLTKEALGNNE